MDPAECDRGDLDRGERLDGGRALSGTGERPRPNLFVIGAMKSGTTYLAELLGTHPGVFMCAPKEPSYFVEPAQLKKVYRWAWEQGFWKSEDRYLDLFSNAGAATVIGEASTAYTKLPRVTGVAERLHDFAPHAKLIYLMRDPVERSISHYWFAVWRAEEDRPPLRAMMEEDVYRSLSHYAAQLEPYLRLFGGDRIKLLTFEALRDDPHRSFMDLLSWLGVDPEHVPEGLGTPVHVTPDELHRASPIRRLVRDNALLAAIKHRLPSGVLNWARRRSDVTVLRRSEDLADVVDFLRSTQRDQTMELARLVGREFPEWRTLWGTHEQPSASAG